MHITNLSEEICRLFFSRLTLKERLCLRSVCRRWKCTIESMCHQIQSLNFEIVPIVPCLFPWNFKKFLKNFPDDTFDDSLNISQKYITADFGRHLAGLMPNLERLAISRDDCCYQIKHLMFLLQNLNELSSLSIFGAINEESLGTQDTVLKLIATKSKLTRLDFLIKLCDPKYSLLGIPWDLSRELSPILPRLTHFSVRNHTKATLPSTLLQLGPQCSYLRLEQCDCVTRDFPILKCANNLEHLYFLENDTSIPVVLPQFKALRTLKLRGMGFFAERKLILGPDFFTHLNQNPNLSTLIIESVNTLIPIATSELTRYQVKQVKTLTLLSSWSFQQSTNDGELTTGDAFCRLYAALFPEVEIFSLKSLRQIVSENDLRHFAALRKFKLKYFSPIPTNWFKAKWQSVSVAPLI